ncbi:2-amino-4-hydroxy-6-hydroxymethyldihydropteridine diphosphokinase [Legionella worsleiensis]|uniref:2-amino-4-hydroxy-6-hydroxymethyldihydropteridine pyrophosphokinase n=1 Tax=Legionella worsleiensis TaxID=45076 RepID=A0A0W1AJ75_9GAMM|nr:2-amino-4-hydroxy-6-hydroxymethyldihydropteridine diphosphokinase [Legionella worsleiensis]KTD81387.1 2-amino-4-hydroxy-6- hydroxymethyldihydropteridine pyrophosphokinase [Legionella worsleiensis]STY30024.1 2-amino-4-hydroxy-6-hydroxymethyldihydropteridinepyrophosphokinase [Legionella worsleiensis]
MNICFLSLGSNQKSPERQIRMVIKELNAIPTSAVLCCSQIYWTKAWGLKSQQDFCNAVVKISTRLKPEMLLRWCQKIEKKHLRIRKKRWGPRTLDVDIILYGDRAIHTKNLIIPHPHYLHRDFVIEPLLEINPSIKL